MVIDGRAIASEILASVRMQMSARGKTPVVRAVTVQPNAATESYLRIKAARAREAGMELDVVRLADEATTQEVIAAVQKEGADAVIVQLPLPEGIDTPAVLRAIPEQKDADVLGVPGTLLPPVVAAVKEILERSDVSISGKKIVVVGKGKLVGEPVAKWLLTAGADVSIVTREQGNMDVLKESDIVISGAGQAGLIVPSLLKEGVVLIDAGTSESGGAIAGDADPSCADIASVFTPVPGGVGPIAVACLFRNVALLMG